MASPLRAALTLSLVVAHAAAASGSTLVVLDKARAEARLIDPATGVTRATVPTGAGPHEGAASPDGRVVVVADYGAEVPGRTLTVIDVAAARVVRTVDLAPHARPHGLAWTTDGRLLLVTSETSGALLM